MSVVHELLNSASWGTLRGFDSHRLHRAPPTVSIALRENRFTERFSPPRSDAAAASRDTRAMASANLELARSMYGRWARGDFSSVAWADPEIEYVIVDGPSPGRWSGLAGLEKGGLGFMGAWEDLRVKADEYRELDDDRVLVLTSLSGRGKTSGVELGHLHGKGADVLHVSNGRVIRFMLYF